MYNEIDEIDTLEDFLILIIQILFKSVYSGTLRKESKIYNEYMLSKCINIREYYIEPINSEQQYSEFNYIRLSFMLTYSFLHFTTDNLKSNTTMFIKLPEKFINSTIVKDGYVHHKNKMMQHILSKMSYLNIKFNEILKKYVKKNTKRYLVKMSLFEVKIYLTSKSIRWFKRKHGIWLSNYNKINKHSGNQNLLYQLPTDISNMIISYL